MSSWDRTHLSFCPVFKVGDQPPRGYQAWHEWAEVQYQGGLRQKVCPRCCLWRFPQETCRAQGTCPKEKQS